MWRLPMAGLILLFLAAACGLAADETPLGKGLSQDNQQQLVIDDLQDVSDWYNGSPEETTLSRSDRFTRDSRPTLCFANTVDHTKGEKKYPVGWPRVGRDLGRDKLTDWSSYDFFECWIYADTDRETLPAKPLGVGFYHSGPRQSSHVPLAVRKDAWTRIEIPVAQLLDPADVQRIQFNISESDYRHGDRVDFYLDRPALVRYVQPVIKTFAAEQTLVYGSQRVLRTRYELSGSQGLDQTRVELSIRGTAAAPLAAAAGTAARQGELAAAIAQPLTAGRYRARLELRDPQGRLLDRREAEFRAIAGPFSED